MGTSDDTNALREELQAKAREQGRVLFAGWQAEAARLLADLDVYVLDAAGQPLTDDAHLADLKHSIESALDDHVEKIAS